MARKIAWFLPLVCLIFITACGRENGENVRHHMGDLRETTAEANVLPEFLREHSDEMKQIYSLAAEYRDLLAWVPCYCGCGDSAGHKNNLNCFIHQWNEDGSVVWDDHATRCNACLSIAVESVKMKMDGMDTLEIRQAIDNKYSQGYAAPTPTPMPSSEFQSSKR